MKTNLLPTLILVLCMALSCTGTTNQHSTAHYSIPAQQIEGLSKAYFASGCFWCVEAIFEEVKGVEEVISGYSGGNSAQPTYSEVSSGKTRHAESVEVYYDPKVVSYATLLKVFFGSHDPTTLNQQGPDRGPQYRSVIFYQNAEEKALAEAYVNQLEQENVFNKPIVTEIVAFDKFYPAEAYHQDYEKNHPENPYVRSVSIPRLNRFKDRFPELLK